MSQALRQCLEEMDRALEASRAERRRIKRRIAGLHGCEGHLFGCRFAMWWHV